MYEVQPLTVGQLKELLAGMPDDAVIVADCCQSSYIAHEAQAVTFDSSFSATPKVETIPAVELRKDERGRQVVVLNMDDDFVGITSLDDDEPFEDDVDYVIVADGASQAHS